MSKNITEEAWNATRNSTDPVFGAIPEVGFRENLEFRAAKVRETGIATTNFEKKVAELLASEAGDDSGPMAVVAPPAGVDYNAAAEGLVEKTAEEKAELKKADDAAKQARVEAAKNLAAALEEKSKESKTDSKPVTKDESGHVPTAAEKTAAAKEAKKAPLK